MTVGAMTEKFLAVLLEQWPEAAGNEETVAAFRAAAERLATLMLFADDPAFMGELFDLIDRAIAKRRALVAQGN